MDQAYYDQLYMQQLAEYERDTRLSRIVTVLQGIAALLAIVVAIRVMIKH